MEPVDARTARPRRLGMLACLAAAVIIVLVAGVRAASAGGEHPSLRVTCTTGGGWTVGYHVPSWQPGTGTGRTNPRVEVAYETATDAHLGRWTALPWVPAHAFTEENGLAFEDTFTVPAGDVTR